MTRLHLDYETASEVNIKTAGAHKYASDPSTRILMLGWAIDDDPVELWEAHKGPAPARLTDALRSPHVRKHAFNAQFERLITRYCLGVEVPPEQWRCTMVESYYLGFAGGLDKTLGAVGLEGKDKRGGQLINVFCTPAPKNHKAAWYDWANKPAEWEEFCDYCRQDVHVERRLWHWMQQFPTMSDWDYAQWCADQRINDRGVPMDTDFAASAIELWDIERQALTRELQDLTGLPRVTRGPFLEWLQTNTGAALDTLRKDYLAAELKHGRLPDAARPAVELWAQKEAKATAKYNAVINASMPDDRARGMFQYKGASRTDRVGGRLIQLQNLKRPFLEPGKGEPPESYSARLDRLVYGVGFGSSGLLKGAYGMPVADILGGAIRHVIRAEEGKTLVACDLSSIESVVLGWITECHKVDDTFRNGRDTYKVFASEYYGTPYDEVTKKQRTFAKPPVLGAGYMLGWRGLIAYAEGYGVDMTAEEAKRAVNTFRTMYPEIPAFWKWVYSAVMSVTQNGGEVTGYRMRIERDAEFLRIWLPSGRALSYYRPEVRKRAAPWSDKTMTAKAGDAPYGEWLKLGWTDAHLVAHGYMEEVQWLDNFSYMGMNEKNQWTRIYAHAGGITENCVSGDAEVLTDRGAVRLRDVRPDDRVWDGLEFVSHEGRVYQGFQPCLSVDGVWMTPDHKVMTDAGWTPASKVPGCGGPARPSHVYDLLNCGPRHRFTVLGASGPFLAHNCVQSIAGDILWSGIMRAEAAGLPVILHVHDEIGIEVETDAASAALATLESCMTQQPEWAADMWLGATGFITKRYTKD